MKNDLPRGWPKEWPRKRQQTDSCSEGMMANNDFKVGDRVACYNCSQRYVGQIREFDTRQGRTDIVVVDIDKPEMDTLTFNVKQCRRLRKKKPRIVYVKYRENGEVEAWNLTGKAVDRLHDGSWIKFREVSQARRAHD